MMKISLLKENEENPRYITESKFERLKKSIRAFPEMLQARPIVINKNNEVIGGSMRFKAAKALNMKEVPVFVADSWTEQQEEEFIIKDNLHSGKWDFDFLANKWDQKKLESFGFEKFTFSEKPEMKEKTKKVAFKFTEDQIETVRLAIAKATNSEELPYISDDKKANALHFILSKYLNG